MSGNMWRCIITQDVYILRWVTRHQWIMKILLTKCPELVDHYKGTTTNLSRHRVEFNNTIKRNRTQRKPPPSGGRQGLIGKHHQH